MRSRGLVSVVALACIASIAHAHRPTMSDGLAIDAEHAIVFTEVQISRVVYHEVTPKAPQVWITFEVTESQDLFLQIGVPKLRRLKAYRPQMALLGPGLPGIELPFEVPMGLGGFVLETGDIEAPEEFFEPFTRTRSWILRETDVRLPEAGRYYVVAYDPDGQTGKLWAALGRLEAWGPADLLAMPKIVADVRAFHEHAPLIDPDGKPMPSRVIFDFRPGDSESAWSPVNDSVMGGLSDGRSQVTDEGILEFRGTVSLENNGGFASVRSRPGEHDLTGFEGLMLRVRGDGQRYSCNLRTDFALAGGSYQARFDTREGVWEQIPLRFEDFEARSYGRLVPNAPPLDLKRIRSLGLTISDKQAGPFALQVDWIGALKELHDLSSEDGSATAACARCVLGMEGVPDCRLAVQMGNRRYLVQGSGIDDHGDAHAKEGLCNVARRAVVRGAVAGDRIVIDEMRILPQ